MAKRIGGHLVAESLAALGAETAFGVPGIHALPIWEGLREGSLSVYGTRSELAAGFAADGYARSSGQPAPLLLSTGPGALNSLTALMEAASAHVPVVAISSQIPSHLIGRGRGYLHELPDQLASFAPIVKEAARAHSVESIPALLAQAWRIALTPPSGPVYLEIPVDLLRAPAPGGPVTTLEAMVERQCAPLEQVTAAATRLAHARHPVIWAGGGVLRSAATHELRELAELLQAPVATTYMGKGAIAGDHPLAAGAGCDEAALAGAALDRRRGAVRRHRARRRDDRPVRAALRRPGHPSRRRPRPHRRQLQRHAPRRRRQAHAAGARRRTLPRASRAVRVRAPGARVGGAGAHPLRPGVPGARDGARPTPGHRGGAPARCRHRLGHDHPRLLGGPAPAPVRRPAVPVPDGIGDPRLRVAGRDRRARRAPRAPGARGNGRRRPAVHDRRAGDRGPARHRRQAARH